MAARTKRSKEMVQWVTELLDLQPIEPPISHFDEFKTGVHILQVIHSIAPMSFDLNRCDFLASTQYHYEKNWKVIQEVMIKNDINRDFIIERMSQGEKQRDLYMFVVYLQMHYETLKEQRMPSEKELANPKLSTEKRVELELAMLPYDAYAERRSAQEKRKKMTRMPGTQKFGRFSFDTRSMSESSISAFSSYSTRGMMKKVRFKSTGISAWVEGTEQPLINSGRRSCSTPGSVHSDETPRGGAIGSVGVGGGGNGTPMRRDTSPVQQFPPGALGGLAMTGGNTSSGENAGGGSSSASNSPNHPLGRVSLGGSVNNGCPGSAAGTPHHYDPTTHAARRLVGAAMKSPRVDGMPPTAGGGGSSGGRGDSNPASGGGSGGRSTTSPTPQAGPPAAGVGTNSVSTQLDFTSSGGLSLMTTGPSSSSLGAGGPGAGPSSAVSGGTSLANNAPNSTTTNLSQQTGGFSEDHFLREVILMDAVECPMLGNPGTHFWAFDAWPKAPAGVAGVIHDVAGDRVHKLFSYEEVKRSARIRQEQQSALNAVSPVSPTAPDSISDQTGTVVKESSVAWELSKTLSDVATAPPEVVADPGAKHLSMLGAVNNNWGDFDAMMEELN